MNKDRIFKHIEWLLDQSIGIWNRKETKNYELADKYYNEAIALKSEHFPEENNLTNEIKNC